ncbi:MAG: PcfJ domain-containing protein [Oscillospiraceae bacterium]
MPNNNKDKNSKEFKKENSIFKAMPNLTEKHLLEINKAFTPYLFYEDDYKKGIKKCWCSSCNTYFEYDLNKRTENKNHYEFITAAHNDFGYCPKCGRNERFKQTGKAKECKNLYEYIKIVVVLPKEKNQVYFRCYYAIKNYCNKNYIHNPKLSESTRYYLTPGTALKFKNDYAYYMQFGLNPERYKELKSVGEPFAKAIYYNNSVCEEYKIIDKDEISKTFLKYSCLDKYKKYYSAKVPIIKYLCNYAKYPCIEMMIKFGLYYFVDSLINSDKPMKKYINWNGKNPQEVFKMSTEQFNDLRKHCENIDDFKAYQALKNAGCKVDFQKTHELNKKFGFYNIEKLAIKIKNYKLNLTRVLNYLEKQKNKKDDYQLVITFFNDYLDFAKELKYDLSKETVIYPKKLKDAHDSASNSVTITKDKIGFEKYKNRFEKLEKLYKYSNNKYEIVVPIGINHIIEEGKKLSHCVGGYADRHIIGATTILFMRKCNNITTPFITIEFNKKEKRIMQNRGFKNRILTSDENDFLYEWLKWVKAGSKRKKNSKSAAA